MTERETFDKSYIALPISKSPLLDYVQRINPHKNFFHLSVYFLDELDEDSLVKVRSAVSEHAPALSGTTLRPNRLELFGPSSGVLVLKIDESKALEKLRAELERSLPEYASLNAPFEPHITVEKLKYATQSKGQREQLIKRNGVKEIEPYRITNVGVYYATEEGATALLYSKKI